MDSYKATMGVNGEIVLPIELRDLLGLTEGDVLELYVDTAGKFFVETAERSVGPLSDFFEDLILGDLHCEGCSGDAIQGKLLERKLQLSTTLDRLAEEARRIYKQGHAINWRETPELGFLGIGRAGRGMFKLMLTSRTERDLRKLKKLVLQEVPSVFESLEQDPLIYKRLKGPYYETYRVSFNGENMQHYRVIYTVFEEEKAAVVLNIGERQSIYDFLKGIS